MSAFTAAEKALDASQTAMNVRSQSIVNKDEQRMLQENNPSVLQPRSTLRSLQMERVVRMTQTLT